MDSSNGIETPEYDWFWPSKTVERTDSSDDDDEPEPEPDEEYDSDSEKSKSNDSDSDSDEDAENGQRPQKRPKHKPENPKTVPAENPDFTVNTNWV